MLRKIPAILGILAASMVVTSCSKPQGVALPVAGGPPLGHYVCWSSGFDKLYSGEFDIQPDGRYTGVLNRGGKFVYDQMKKTIVFTTGDFEYWDFVAVYQTAAESKNGRERLVLKDESWETPIGQESAGDYQYCYMEEKTPATALSRDNNTAGN